MILSDKYFPIETPAFQLNVPLSHKDAKYKNRGINIFLPETCQKDGPWVLVIVVNSDAPSLAIVEIGSTVFVAVCLSYSCGSSACIEPMRGNERESKREEGVDVCVCAEASQRSPRGRRDGLSSGFLKAECEGGGSAPHRGT